MLTKVVDSFQLAYAEYLKLRDNLALEEGKTEERKVVKLDRLDSFDDVPDQVRRQESAEFVAVAHTNRKLLLARAEAAKTAKKQRYILSSLSCVRACVCAGGVGICF